MIATKEQERKTLEKIKLMVAELGENSYLATAFTGAFELAEQNIDNDWALSVQEYIEMAAEAKSRAKEDANEITMIRAELEAVQRAHQGTTKALEETSERARNYAFEIDGLKDELKAAQLEVIKLKAKLYDYIAVMDLNDGC